MKAPVPLAHVSPPLVFAGRGAELDRILDALSRLETAVIYGIAGSGKSALATAVAARFGAPVIQQTLAPGMTLADAVQKVRSAVGGHDAAVAVLDDVHQLPEGDRAALLAEVGTIVAKGRVLATSRELIPPGTIDRVEVRLCGLDLASARDFWSALDALHSPTFGFEAAWERSRGNPFLLRCAHAGDLESNPIADSVASFGDDELRLAGMLALCDLRLPQSELPLHLRDGLRQLVRRLVVEVDGAGLCSFDELYRDAVLDQLSIEQQVALRTEIVTVLETSNLEPVAKIPELCAQLRALDRHEDAGAHLLAAADTLVRSDAAESLLEQIESIPRERRSAALCIERAKVLVRLLDMRRAYEELERLVHGGLEPRREIRMLFAKVATLSGHLDAAESVLRKVLADPPPDPFQVLRAWVIYSLVRTYQGDVEDARLFLDELRRQVAVPYVRGVLALNAAFALWLDERDGEALELTRTGAAILHDEPPGFVRDVLAPGLAATLLARHARFEEAEEASDATERALERYANSRARTAWRVLRASFPFERGERLRALTELRSLAHTFERGGDVLSLLWTRAWIGRVLMILGRRHEATAILDETEHWAQARGVVTVVRAVERARRQDPLVQIGEAGPAAIVEGKPGAAARARAIAAVRAARSGAALEVRGLVEANAGTITAPDFALDRALGQLAQAVLLRTEGRAAEATAALEEAARVAIGGGADADLIPALAEAVGALRLVTPVERGMTSGTQIDLSAYEVVLDGRAQELRSGRRVMSFKRRPVLRRLLFALANRPRCVVSKEELANLLWPGAYNPLVHDNSLKVNVRHLRQLIGRAGLAIEFEDVGYRLVVPERFVYIDAT